MSELGLMGRRVVWNGNTPNAINYRTVSDIVKIIKNESNYMGKFTPKVATEVKEYLQFRDDWLDTDFCELPTHAIADGLGFMGFIE